MFSFCFWVTFWVKSLSIFCLLFRNKPPSEYLIPSKPCIIGFEVSIDSKNLKSL